MKQRFFSYTVALCTALSAIALLTGCREDTIIKSSLTPAVDNIHTFGIGPDFNNGTDDLIKVSTTTAYEDSIITSTRLNGFPIFQGLGWVTDPFAGTTAGSIYMQVVPTATGFKFPNNATIDELVLVLPYSGFTWGDTAAIATRKINVYRITESFSKDTTYYNTSRLSTGDLVGTATMQTGPVNTGSIQDSVLVLGRKRAPHLRIRLTDAFKADFITALNSDSTFDLFTKAFQGLYIVPDTTGAGATLPYFRLNGPADIYSTAGIIAYGHTNGASDTLIYQFPYDERYAAHINRITRNYAGTETGRLMQSKDSSILVMQNAPGAVFDVVLPNIQDLPKNVIINKAELVFTQVPDPTGSETRFFGPLRLYPQGINSSGGTYTIADRYPVVDATLDFIGGTPRQVTRGGRNVTEFRINIPREVQKAIVQGSNSLHLHIGGTVNFPGAYRLIVGGRGQSDPVYRPSINIIYSKQ